MKGTNKSKFEEHQAVIIDKLNVGARNNTTIRVGDEGVVTGKSYLDDEGYIYEVEFDRAIACTMKEVDGRKEYHPKYSWSFRENELEGCLDED